MNTLERSIKICEDYVAKISLLGGCKFVFAIKTDENSEMYSKICIAYTKNIDYETIKIPEFVECIGVKIEGKKFFENIYTEELENSSYNIIPRIEIKDYITTIREQKYLYAFKHSRVKKVVLGKNVEMICSGSFIDSKIKEVVVNNSLVDIGDSSFYNCENLSRINLEDASDTLSIGRLSFNRCEGLKTMDLSKVLNIEEYAFRYCAALENVLLPKNKLFNTIKKYVFCDCRSLEEIIIPSNIININNGAFFETKRLDKIRIESNREITIGKDAFIILENPGNMELTIDTKFVNKYDMFYYAFYINSTTVVDINNGERKCMREILKGE